MRGDCTAEYVQQGIRIGYVPFSPISMSLPLPFSFYFSFYATSIPLLKPGKGLLSRGRHNLEYGPTGYSPEGEVKVKKGKGGSG